MKVITKRDLAVIDTLRLHYKNISGATIRYHLYNTRGHGGFGFNALVRIPEEKEEVLVSFNKHREPDMLFLPDPNPPVSHGEFTTTTPRVYALRNGTLHRINP